LFCVGFAAETADLEQYARDKLQQKRLDMIVANWVGPSAVDTAGTFGSDTNALQVFWHDGDVELPLASKAQLARQLMPIIASQYEQRRQHVPRSKNIVELNKASRPKS
jgi:phosphopantothenoylcysteine decarboxylase/phosphopantothenate--cysteine ligase